MLAEEYRKKLVNADEAVKCVESGDWVELGFFANFPKLLSEALSRRKEELRNVKLRTGPLLSGPCAPIESDPSGEHFLLFSWHFGPFARQYAKTSRAFYIPVRYGETPRYLRESLDTDVVMVEVTPMDKHGYFNFGVSVHHFIAAMEKARKIIVEVNEAMPRSHGGYEHCVHISKVDYIVECGSRPMPIIPPMEPSEIEKQIAEHVISEIQDGACLQLGIGGMPNTLANMLAESDVKDLGMHSEMLADAAVNLVEAGKLTGLKKKLDPGRIAFTFAAGTKRLYDFLDDNPICAGYPVDYTNLPTISSQNDNVVSINACVEVDLTGQICSESIGKEHFSGTGGQLEFVEAGYYSKNGKSIVCLPSTLDKKGILTSRIKPLLTPGATVTDPRTCAHYIVTEFGIAKLKGLSTWQRAEALINIANPIFRDELIKEADNLKIWRNSNKI